MWSELNRATWHCDTLARWLIARVRPGMSGRRNFRVVCAEPGIASLLQARLDGSEIAGVRWFVRSSAANDAVRLRHGRPDGVPPDVCVAFVLLWSEGSAEADRNAQSLVDLPAVDVADILGDPLGFELPAEAAIRDRLEAAAQSWDPPLRPRVQQHLVAAWTALRTALRLAPRQAGHALRLVDSLDAWGRFLDAAQVTEDSWVAWPEAERAERILRHLGNALAELRLFAFPAWSSVLGVVATPPVRPDSPKRTGEDRWDRELEALLLENLQWASDHGALADAIAGKRSVREQIDELVNRGGVRLGADVAAPAVLERFCHDGDERAFSKVEWMFHEDANNRRSRSMGLHGLLIARGRRQARVDPLEKLALDTEALFGVGLGEADQATLRRFLEANRRTKEGRTAIVALCEELAGGERRESSAEVRALTDAVLARQADAAEEARTLGARWAAVDTHSATPDVVSAPTLLLGLARLLARESDDQTRRPGDEMVLTLLETDRPDTCTEVFAVDANLPAAVGRWMRERVREAWLVEEPDDTEEESDAAESMSFAVSRSGKNGRRVGTVRLDWSARERRWREGSIGEVLTSRSVEWSDTARAPSGVTLLRHVHQRGVRVPSGVEALNAGWTAYIREAGLVGGTTAAHCEVLDLVAPLGPAAQQWVERWADTVDKAAAGREAERVDQRRAQLQAQMNAAVGRTDLAAAMVIFAEIQSLLGTVPATPGMPIESVRKVLQVETSTVGTGDAVQRLVMSPHHPLVLRLRILADRLLADIVTALWRGEWPSVAKDELNEALGDWSLPEPQHVYGNEGASPLTFDGWVAGFAVFTPLDGVRDTDAATLGVRSARDVVTQYAKLYPGAADRLRLRIAGDETARWAWGILSDRGGLAALRADVDVVTHLPARAPNVIETEALASGDGLAVFEPGADGVTPAVRFRRVRATTSSDRHHLSLVLADRLSAFRAAWGDDAEPDDSLDLWDTRLLFHEPRAEAVDYRVQIREAPDRLSAAVARAVARACNRDAPFSETYTFDPSIAGPVLRAEQGRTDWLVLTSRQPAYRAIQACGDVAALLDFGSRIEGGRPVHVCVSLGEDRRAECAATLERACKTLLGDVGGGSAGILARARTLAPGLALRALGSSSIALEGLLGLLLTEAAVGASGQLVLSLDQHLHLLSGGGPLADLVTLRCEGDAVRLGVAEAKFTLGVATAAAEPVPKAVRQLQSTVGRLARFAAQHSLAGRTRAALVRAALQQVHLLNRARPAEELRTLALIVDRIADPAVPIHVDLPAMCQVHVWSCNAATKDAVDTSAGPTVRIYGREATLERLRQLGVG